MGFNSAFKGLKGKSEWMSSICSPYHIREYSRVRRHLKATVRTCITLVQITGWWRCLWNLWDFLTSRVIWQVNNCPVTLEKS